MKHRLMPIVFLILIYSVFMYLAVFHLNSLNYIFTENPSSPTDTYINTESYLKENVFSKDFFSSLKLNIKYLLGEREFDGIYYTKDRYIKKLELDKSATIFSKNINSIKSLTERFQNRASIVLTPTASAIYQDEMPLFTNADQANQRAIIEKAYKRLGDDIVGIDVYPRLFANNKKDLFYKTDTGITSYAGYLIYQNLSYRLGFNAYSLDNFKKISLGDRFYGNMYNKSSINQIEPDNIFYYKFNKTFTGFVENWSNKECKTYYTLFPEEATINNSPMNIFLGGEGLHINIKNSAPNIINRNILIIGDSNAINVLPFLSLHYSDISFWNTDSKDYIETTININNFDELIMLFSIDNMLNQPIYSQISAFL